MAGYQSTYRVQLSAGFGFAAARAVVPYLADLGASHLYTSPILRGPTGAPAPPLAALRAPHLSPSPILRARTGSAHGYDVVDPTQVAPELGGEAGLRDLVAALRSAGMGLIVDLVPNHLTTSDHNPCSV